MNSNKGQQNSYLIHYLQFFVVILFALQNTVFLFTQNSNSIYLSSFKIFTDIADTCLIPLFIFSIALSLNNEIYRLNFYNFFKKKILDILLLYIISLFLVAPIINYYVNASSDSFFGYLTTYNFGTSSPGPLWILPVIIIFDVIFFLILSKLNFAKFISKIEELENTKIFLMMFLVLFFSYAIPFGIIEEQTFISFPINYSSWYALGIIWIPKTKILLLFSIYFLGIVITNSDKLFRYTLSSNNKLSDTYVYKIIESVIIYILLTTINAKIQLNHAHFFELIYSLLFLLLMLSTSMAIVGIFDKLCTRKSHALTNFSKYNYWIYAINTLPVVILYKTLSGSPQLTDIQKIYVITLFTLTLCCITGLIVRKIPLIKNIIPNTSHLKA